MMHANKKDSDQPAHPQNLVGTFVFSSLASLFDKNPDDSFSFVVALISKNTIKGDQISISKDFGIS